MSNLLQLTEEPNYIDASISENIRTMPVTKNAKLFGILCISIACAAFLVGIISLLMKIALGSGNGNAKTFDQPFAYSQQFTILLCSIVIYAGLLGYYKMRAVYPTIFNTLSIIGAGLITANILGKTFFAVLVNKPKLSNSFLWFLLLAFLFPILTTIGAIVAGQVSSWKKFVPLIIPISMLAIYAVLQFTRSHYQQTEWALTIYLPLLSIFAGILGIATFTEAKSAEEERQQFSESPQ